VDVIGDTEDNRNMCILLNEACEWGVGVPAWPAFHRSIRLAPRHTVSRCQQLPQAPFRTNSIPLCTL
jgi:hypothetical protein